MSDQIQSEPTPLEIDPADIAKEAERLLKPTESAEGSAPKYDTKWGKNLPERRVQLSETEVEAFADIEQIISKNLNEEEHPSMPAVPNFSGAPTSPTEAVKGAGGYKLDTGKARWELAPLDAFEAIVKVQTWAVDPKARGDKAYPERNWERGMSWGRVFGAMMRHAWKWWLGKLGIPGYSVVDEESGMSHAWHFACCACFLVSYEIRGLNEFDDRPANIADKKN